MKMGMPIVWRWWVMVTCYCGPWIIHHPHLTTHKDVCDIDLVRWCIQGCGTLVTCREVWHLGGWHFSYIFLLQFVSKAITTATTIVQIFCNNNNTTKISNVMPKIQVAKNIVFFLTTPSLENVVASSSNEKKLE
jgi:hypothetical protein